MRTALRSRLALVGILAVMACPTSDAHAQRRSFGGWLRQRVNEVDQAVQNRLERNPDVQRRVNRGIDVFADNVIDFATPESDDRCRRVQRDAVHMLLNPNHRESSRRFDDMIGTITGRETHAPSRATNRSNASTRASRVASISHTVSRPQTISRPQTSVRSNNDDSSSRRSDRRTDPSRPTTPSHAVSVTRGSEPAHSWDASRAAKSLAALWDGVEEGTARAITFVRKVQGRVAALLHDEFDLDRDASQLGSWILVGVVLLMALRLLWQIPRAGLKSRLRRLEREMESMRAQART